MDRAKQRDHTRGGPHRGRRADEFEQSEYGSLPRRYGRPGRWSGVTGPREFMRAVLETLHDVFQDPFVIAGAVTGVLAGGLSYWLLGSLLIGLGVLAFAFLAVVLMQLFF